MKLLSDVRLLLLSIWLGSAVFFIAVAQSAFAVLPQRELAGAMVSRTLAILNFGGLAIALILILTSFIGAKNINRVSAWIERFLLLVVGAACGLGQFVIGLWLSMLRSQMGRPIDEIPADDPLRVQFQNLHNWSEWVLLIAMVAALIAFFQIARRKFGVSANPASTDPYNFEKEFKI
ncbi:MAG TPA: DUF4149 domain-containing protein [Pyrinomonadaceae bacterium]|nr:DUF4149 domain-containing protein [Pyrinomonadaceae bacterium]